MSVSDSEFRAMLLAPAGKRFEYFVKRAADNEKVWGIWGNGWLMMTSNEGIAVFPVWPAARYALALCDGEWNEYRPRAIALNELLDELALLLEQKGSVFGVFPTPSGQGVMVQPGHLVQQLRAELEQYE